MFLFRRRGLVWPSWSASFAHTEYVWKRDKRPPSARSVHVNPNFPSDQFSMFHALCR